MYKIQFKRETNYKQNQYCILQFKGKFETESSDTQNEHKSLIHLGQLKKTQNQNYKLQIGVMDLLGKEVNLPSKQLLTQTITNQNNNTKIILIKGIITKKIVFQGRPTPDMNRVQTIKRQSLGQKMFAKAEEKLQYAQSEQKGK